MILVALRVAAPLAAQSNDDFRRRVLEQQRAVRERIEEDRQRMREQQEQFRADAERRRQESEARRQEAEDRRRERASQPALETRPLEPAAPAPWGDAAAPAQAPDAGAPGTVRITPVRVAAASPAAPPPTSPSSDASPLTHALVTGLAVGAVLFLLGGFVLGRELSTAESTQVAIVSLLVTGLGALHGIVIDKVAPKSPTLELKSFTSPEGRFSIAMPEPHERAEQPAMGITVTQHVYVAKDGAYMIGYFDLPAWMAQQNASTALENACNGSVQKMGGRESSRTAIVLATGQPGREVEGELPNQVGRFRFRAYLAGSRFYYITSTGFDAWVHGPTTKSFLDSFEITSP